MESSKKFVVKKDARTDIITYMEYEKLKGINIKPKHNASFEDMINVDEMIIINPSLIQKLIKKKCARTFEKIIKMLSVICEDDSTDDEAPFMLILDEVERFKNLVVNKYKDYMKEKEYSITLKKLEILQKEVMERKNYIIERQIEYEVSRRGKSSR